MDRGTDATAIPLAQERSSLRSPRTAISVNEGRIRATRLYPSVRGALAIRSVA